MIQLGMNSSSVVDSGKEIKVIISREYEPYLNISREKAIFSDLEENNSPEVLYLWVNDDCLVAGQIKSAKYGWYHEEVAEEMNIPVYRRFTGGGVVFHDRGNLNWSLFLKKKEGLLSPERIFREYSKFVIKAIKRLGAEAYFAPPNRIEVEGKKVSGMAARVGLRSFLIHGTLLLHTNLEKLRKLCIPPPGSPDVANLQDWIPGITSDVMTKSIISAMQEEGYNLLLSYE